jgi:pimeloyl-ACP methyl ester carboxylesterase
MTAPTLVVHGEQDIFVPPANALVLAERIPGAQLRLWPDAGHMYIIDEPRADREIARFLLHHSAVRPARDLPPPDSAGLSGHAHGVVGGQIR